MPSFTYKSKYRYSIKKPGKSRKRKTPTTNTRSRRFRTSNSNNTNSVENRSMIKSTFHIKMDVDTNNKYSRIFNQTSSELREFLIEKDSRVKNKNIPIDFFDRVLENFLKKTTITDLEPRYAEYRFSIDNILQILRNHTFSHFGTKSRVPPNIIKNLHLLNDYVSSSTSEVHKPLTMIAENNQENNSKSNTYR